MGLSVHFDPGYDVQGGINEKQGVVVRDETRDVNEVQRMNDSPGASASYPRRA